VTPVKNATIADLLRRYAAILRLQQADRFKIKAYMRAADTLEVLDAQATEFLSRGRRLEDLPGIGKAIGGVIRQILETGTFPALESALATVSPELAELATRPALDPKVALRVYKKLGIRSLEELRASLESGAIERGLGAPVAYRIRLGLDDRPRVLLWKAEPVARAITEVLLSQPDVSLVSTAGSLRRKKDTIGDLAFLVAGTRAAPVIKRFSHFGGVKSVDHPHTNSWIFQLSSALRINLTWTKEKEWGLAQILATGSTLHLDGLSSHAATNNVRLSRRALIAAGVDIAEEKSIYTALGLEFIEPELREGRGEVEAAAHERLPKLVASEDLKGDLHMHTTSSDGANSIVEMAKAAQAQGYSYVGITDHSQSLKIAGGLTEKQLHTQLTAIDKINAGLTGFVILKSAEVDILEDGSLDYSDAILKELDYTICSIHSRFRLNKQQQTTRIMRAMDNPHFTMLGHATGRLLLKREGYDVDFGRIVKHAKEVGCSFEINSSPDRLDLSDAHARMAKGEGIKIAVNTDAHSVAELGFMSAGLNQARRAWLEPKDVLNTFPLSVLIRLLRR
jgi:DNA polymerase (family 10)